MTRSLAGLSSYQGVRATVLGLGNFGGGVAAARFLAERGAIVTVTDQRSEDELASSLAALDGVPIQGMALGGHPQEVFDGCQLVVVNPAVKPTSPEVARCRAAGLIVTSEIELFLHHCRARVVAVSGSNGKSTTAALIHHFLTHGTDEGSSDRPRPDGRAWLGGNIGISLLPAVDDMAPDDFAVLELSSFQLHYLRDTSFSPSVAVVTNFAANHLDWHGDISDYHAAKQVLLSRQSAEDFSVMPEDFAVNQPMLASEGILPWRVRGRCLRFGVADSGEEGVFFEDGMLVFRNYREEDAFRISQPTQLLGVHNAKNIAAAAGATWCLGMQPSVFLKSLPQFRSLPHRLELVASGKGLQFYNDSVSTTPESAIAALETFDRPIVIIVGGSDKGADLTAFVNAISARATAAVLIGQTAEQILTSLQHDSNPCSGLSVVVANDFQNAFSQAVALASQGGIVLLSPGCASYGWFRDFRDRGEQFTRLAQAWVKE